MPRAPASLNDFHVPVLARVTAFSHLHTFLTLPDTRPSLSPILTLPDTPPSLPPQDDSALELLQTLLCSPAAAAPLSRELCDGSGLPLLKDLEPLVLQADLGQLVRTNASLDGESLGAMMRHSPGASGLSPAELGGGHLATSKSLLSRVFAGAAEGGRRARGSGGVGGGRAGGDLERSTATTADRSVGRSCAARACGRQATAVW